MGTPERQGEISPISVIIEEALYQYDELDEATWKRIIQKSLEYLGPLKNVSGFKPLSGILNIELCRRFRQIVDMKNLEFCTDGVGPNSLCRKMARVFSAQSRDGERKDEQELFLLKDGGFALFSGYYVFSSIPISGGESEWRAFMASFQPVEQGDLPTLSAKSKDPNLFWGDIFRSIYELSCSDHEQKRERAEFSEQAFERINRMRTKIILPGNPA